MRVWLGMLIATLVAAAATGVFIWRANQTSFGQPAAERRMQAGLPQSRDALWALLGTTAIGEDARQGLFAAHFPKGVSALDGKDITVSGFMLPLESKTETEHFLLTRNTPVCPFCPPGHPNEVIEVRSSGPVYPDTDEVTVTGRFGLQNDASAGLFFRIDNADVTG